MATTRASVRKTSRGKRVAAVVSLVLLLGLVVLYATGYRFAAQIFIPEWSGYHFGPNKAFTDYVCGGYKDEAGYSLQVGRLFVTCMKVVASQPPDCRDR